MGSETGVQVLKNSETGVEDPLKNSSLSYVGKMIEDGSSCCVDIVDSAEKISHAMMDSDIRQKMQSS